MVNGDDRRRVNEPLSASFAFAQHPQVPFTRCPFPRPVDGFLPYPQGSGANDRQAIFLHAHPSTVRSPVDFQHGTEAKSLIGSGKKELAKQSAF